MLRKEAITKPQVRLGQGVQWLLGKSGSRTRWGRISEGSKIQANARGDPKTPCVFYLFFFFFIYLELCVPEVKKLKTFSVITFLSAKVVSLFFVVVPQT